MKKNTKKLHIFEKSVAITMNIVYNPLIPKNNK